MIHKLSYILTFIFLYTQTHADILSEITSNELNPQFFTIVDSNASFKGESLSQELEGSLITSISLSNTHSNLILIYDHNNQSYLEKNTDRNDWTIITNVQILDSPIQSSFTYLDAFKPFLKWHYPTKEEIQLDNRQIYKYSLYPPDSFLFSSISRIDLHVDKDNLFIYSYFVFDNNDQVIHSYQIKSMQKVGSYWKPKTVEIINTTKSLLSFNY